MHILLVAFVGISSTGTSDTDALRLGTGLTSEDTRSPYRIFVLSWKVSLSLIRLWLPQARWFFKFLYRMFTLTPPPSGQDKSAGACDSAEGLSTNIFFLFRLTVIFLQSSTRINLLTHFWRPIENVILLWYYTMFTWIKISRAWQIDMETNAHSQRIFFTCFVLSFKSWLNLLLSFIIMVKSSFV